MPSLAYRILDKVASLFGLSFPSFEENPEAEQAAVDAARSWLALIDKGQYSRAWVQAAPKFRETVPEEDWTDEIHRMREALGSAQDRTVVFPKYATSLPRITHGEGVIIRFDTRFEREGRAKELVTFVRTDDGTWRSVAGYHVK